MCGAGCGRERDLELGDGAHGLHGRVHVAGVSEVFESDGCGELGVCIVSDVVA